MNVLRCGGIVSMVWLLGVPAAHAVNGSLGFTASSTQVNVGDTVQFTVAVSVEARSNSSGGSNPFEPVPQEGYQEWFANFYSWERETLRSVSVQAGGQGFSELLNSSAGVGYSNSFSFSNTFTQPGSYSFVASGGWQAALESGFSNEFASRSCYSVDPGVSLELYCDSWSWQYQDANDVSSADGTFGEVSINIEVLAPTVAVPEPATTALWLAGLGLVAWRARRRT